MAQDSLFHRCSLMANPGRTTRPPDCPDNGVYIRNGNGAVGGTIALPPHSPYPIVVEGGAGNDHVDLDGRQVQPILIDGGAGHDSVAVKGLPGSAKLSDQQAGQATVTQQPGPLETAIAQIDFAFLAILAVVFAFIVAIGWRVIPRD